MRFHAYTYDDVIALEWVADNGTQGYVELDGEVASETAFILLSGHVDECGADHPTTPITISIHETCVEFNSDDESAITVDYYDLDDLFVDVMACYHEWKAAHPHPLLSK